MDKRELKREIVGLIKKNIELCDYRILEGNRTLYKVVYDINDDCVSMDIQTWNTPKGCVSVRDWQYGNGFDINKDTSDYRLRKVADRIIDSLELEVKRIMPNNNKK